MRTASRQAEPGAPRRVLLHVLVQAETQPAATRATARDGVGKREYLMPTKKDKKAAPAPETKVRDVFETWLEKQPVRSARSKAGYVSTHESKESS